MSNKKVRFPRPLKGISVSCGDIPVSAGQADEAERVALEKGRFEVRAELADQVNVLQEQVSQRLEDVLQALQHRHQKLLGKISERIPKLVIMAASKIISGLELEPAQVESIVDSILNEAPEGEQLELLLNPEDLHLLRGIHQAATTTAQPDPADSGEDFAQALSGLFGGDGESDGLDEKYPGVTFVEDEALGRGDCLLKSRYGLVDGRVAARLATIEESMSSKS